MGTANSEGLNVDRRRVLVTGGAGFLGSRLCTELVAQGHSVTCLDNFHTGGLHNIAHLQQKPNFQVVERDITATTDFDINVDEIYNLACPASPRHYQSDPVQTIKTCVLGTMNVLDIAKRCSARVLHASTSEIYGDPLVHPQPEQYWGHVNPTGVRACYHEGKRCAETLCFDYHRHYGLEIKIARIFNTYGPRMHREDGRVVSNFIVQALSDEPMTIYGDGSQTRSFCYVDDLVDGLQRLMLSPPDFQGPVNLGNPAEFTILQLAEKILSITGSKSVLVDRPLPADDPRQRQPDITLAREALGWQPTVPLDDGLRKTIRYFDELLSAPHIDLPPLDAPSHERDPRLDGAA